MNKKIKKGFTLVELLVVIAILAVLATVSVVGYTSFIEKANMSVDQQLVDQINKLLVADEVGNNNPPATALDVQNLLKANGVVGFDANLAKNTIYWVRSENRVIIWTVDGGKGKVTYPAEYAEKYKEVTIVPAEWEQLDGMVVVELTEASASSLRAAFKSDSNNVVVNIPEGANISDCLYYLGTSMKNASGNGKDVTVNLNGATISNEKHSNGYYYGLTVPTGGSLTLVDGKVDVPMNSNADPGLVISGGGYLVLRDMEITSNGAAIFPESNASEVLIENCLITSTGGYAIGTNRITSDNIKVVIRNSTINCGLTAVFANCSSELVIEDSTIIGGVHGVVVRAGNATISNTTIKVTDTEPGIYSYKNFNGGAAGGNWFGGNALAAAGIVIGCYYKDDTYSGDANVTLNNVTIETPDATVLPTVVMAARMEGKNATLTYDDASNVGDIKIYGDDWAGAETTFTHAGTITVNGTKMN